MLAARWADVDDLNARARARMVATGEVSGATLVVRDRPVQAGDRVLALRNAYRLGLRNGTLGTVAVVNEAEHSLTLATDDGRRLAVPAGYLEAGHLTHGYAITVHKAQGATTERALLLGNDDLYQELGYVGLSRGRAANHLYVVRAEPEDNQRGTALGAEAEPAADLRRALAVSHAQSLATDLRDGALPLRELFAE